MLQALFLNVKKLSHTDVCRQLDRFSKEIRKQVLNHLFVCIFMPHACGMETFE